MLRLWLSWPVHINMLTVVVVHVLTIYLAVLAAETPLYNDFHYPLEEAEELAQVVEPTTCASTQGWSVIFDGQPVCVLERSFKQWGLLAMLDANGTGRARILRKSVGLLDGIVQPRKNFSASYFEQMASNLSDVPAALALAADNAPGQTDGELSFAGLAQQLAPPRDITEISLGSDVVKFIVSHSGRIKCSLTDITEVQNLSAPLPHGQKVIFDPSMHLQKAAWPSYDFENMKSGLVGGYLRIANVGAYSASGGGFELVALADTSFHNRAHEPAPYVDSMVACNFSAPLTNTYITGCPRQGCSAFPTLAEAETHCRSVSDCGGVTFYPSGKGPGKGGYQLRGCGQTGASSIGERSYVITNEKACGRTEACALPRLPNINYAPAVYVRLREQTPSGKDTVGPESFRYWRADNQSGAVEVPATEFYTNLLDFLNYSSTSFVQHSAALRLPGAEGHRQHDQALSGLLLASNNYVGNQANYGDGIPYWSVNRQDNGSLALIPTTVDDALLDWGLCDTAMDHIGFWLDNYLTSDGQIIYYTWGPGVVDGVGDIGRLSSLYLKARQQCAGCGDVPGAPKDCPWGDKYKPKLLALGRRMLELKAAGNDGRPASAQRGPPRPECQGLVAGCPEADWSHFMVDHSPDNETWYSVNLWLQRGMKEIADFLPADDALGQQLRGNASLFEAQLGESITKSVVPANSSGFAHPLLLPPYARARGDFPVFRNMTVDVRPPIEGHDLASYSNFRFFAEMLLADTLPRDIEGSLLAWHHTMGGRLGGASRFMDHLDDFPSTAWGYAALTNNQTNEFLALLYGHMATYSSRGTFHTTEQLRFESDGDAYRNYSWTYKGDVSLCVPTAVEVSRLTRWQLVFEPFRSENPHRRLVWLGRGAPKRWFQESDGFGVGGPWPTSCGPTHCSTSDTAQFVPLRDGSKIAYHVNSDKTDRRATYNLTISKGNAKNRSKIFSNEEDGTAWFVLRWPYSIQAHSVAGDGCRVVQVEQTNGLVVLEPQFGGGSTVASCAVSGQW